MPVDEKKVPKLQSKPITPISMPEYRYQDYVVSEHFSSADYRQKDEKEKSLDLTGVPLNLL
jgi:hypothetical protein